MWNSSTKCKICLRQFVDEGQEQSVQYRQSILKTGSTHLFDELVAWSTISWEESLPFCPWCLDQIEKLSSCNEDCIRLQNEVKDTVGKFIVESFENRKEVKSKGELVCNVKTEPLADVKANCTICYEVYYEKDSVQNMLSIQDKKNIWKICKLYLLPAILNNECEFDWTRLPLLNHEPFCFKCSFNVHRIFRMNEQLEKATQEMKTVKYSFAIDSFQRQKNENVKKAAVAFDNNNKEFGDGDEDIPDWITLDESMDDDETISPYEPEFPQIMTDDDDDVDIPSSDGMSKGDPLDLNCNANNLNSGKSTIFISTDAHASSQSAGPSFTNYSEPAPGSRPLENEESIGLDLTNSRRASRDLAMHKCSSCNKMFIYKWRLNEHVKKNKTCARFLKNLSSGSNPKSVLKNPDSTRPQNNKNQRNNSTNNLSGEISGMPTLIKYSKYPDLQIKIVNVNSTGNSTSARISEPSGLPEKKLLQTRQSKRKPANVNYFSMMNMTDPKRRALFKCRFCSAEYKTTMQMSAHYQSHYDEATSSRCEICTFVYSKRGQLLKHTKAKHPDIHKQKLLYR